jgi:hypothetical protein
LIVPLSSEIVFDVVVYEGVVISPIMKLDSTNLVGAEFVFDFDVDLNTFMDNTIFGSNTFDSMLQDATELLKVIASFGPELNAVSTGSSTLDGMFSVVGDLQDLSSWLLTYMDLVNQGMNATMLLICAYSLASVAI